MRDHKNKTLGDTIGTIGSMLLFLLFAGCLLIMTASAAGVYGRISKGFDKTFGPTAALRYISNKLMSADSVSIEENGSALIIGGDDMFDVIYFSGGGLYEKTVSASDEVTVDGGSKLFELSDMKVKAQGKLLKITVTFNDDENSVVIRNLTVDN